MDKISVTVFAGEEGIPRDEEAANAWMEMGIPKERIFFIPNNVAPEELKFAIDNQIITEPAHYINTQTLPCTSRTSPVPLRASACLRRWRSRISKLP